jgi:hypothetical protein
MVCTHRECLQRRHVHNNMSLGETLLMEGLLWQGSQYSMCPPYSISHYFMFEIYLSVMFPVSESTFLDVFALMDAIVLGCYQGGIGPAGLSTDDLHVLDLTQAKPRWHRVVVHGLGPGPRYGHVMSLVGQRFLLSISGNDGELVLPRLDFHNLLLVFYVTM